MAEKESFPKFPESNWWAIREQFKKTLPITVTATYLQSLLHLNSVKSAQNLIAPLRQFGLIDQENRPTLRANQWRLDSSYEVACREIVDEVYSQELRDLFVDPAVDIVSLREWFMTKGLGQTAASMAAATYALLKRPLGELVATGKKPAAPSATRNAPKANAGLRVDREDSSPVERQVDRRDHDLQNTTRGPAGPTIHVDLQIHISPEATPEQVDAIFASMAKHMRFE